MLCGPHCHLPEALSRAAFLTKEPCVNFRGSAETKMTRFCNETVVLLNSRKCIYENNRNNCQAAKQWAVRGNSHSCWLPGPYFSLWGRNFSTVLGSGVFRFFFFLSLSLISKKPDVAQQLRLALPITGSKERTVIWAHRTLYSSPLAHGPMTKARESASAGTLVRNGGFSSLGVTSIR